MVAAAGLRDGGLAGFATRGKNIERSMDLAPALRWTSWLCVGCVPLTNGLQDGSGDSNEGHVVFTFVTYNINIGL